MAIKSIAAQSGVQLNPFPLQQKAVRMASSWRQQMLAGVGSPHRKANKARFALWQSSPYGKQWMKRDFLPPLRYFIPYPASNTWRQG
jgi:hypothetical protein